MPTVTFPETGVSVEVAPGTPLGDAIDQGGYAAVEWGCCQGICGTCRFTPGKADWLPPPSNVERGLLRQVEAARDERLACYIFVNGDLEVRAPVPKSGS